MILVALTAVEKIVLERTGRYSSAGTWVKLPVDRILLTDFSGWSALDIFEALSARPVNTQRIVVALEHDVPAATVRGARAQARLKEFVRENNIPWFFDAGEGVGGHLLLENGLAETGQIVAVTGCQAGAAGAEGALALKVAPSELGIVMATGLADFQIPASVSLVINGHTGKFVTPRDVAAYILSRSIASGFAGLSIEIGGEYIAGLSRDGRSIIAAMLVSAGAGCVLFTEPLKVPEAADDSGVRQHGCETSVAGFNEPESLPCIFPDSNASYVLNVEIDATRIRPLVSGVESVRESRDVIFFERAPVSMVYIGSCSGGTYRELSDVLAMIRGRKIEPDTSLVIRPVSRHVLKRLARTGELLEFLEAGAIVLPPGCGECHGFSGAFSACEGRVFSTAPAVPASLIARGKQVFTGSVWTAAAAALRGAVTDPQAFEEIERCSLSDSTVFTGDTGAAGSRAEKDRDGALLPDEENWLDVV